MVKALREIRERRRHQDFVERDDQLTFFRDNLGWDLLDVQRRIWHNPTAQTRETKEGGNKE